MSKAVSFKLLPDVKEAFHELDNKSRFLSDVLTKYDGFCPLCEADLEVAMDDNKVTASGKINSEAEDVYVGVGKPSSYLAGLIRHELGFCAFCGNRGKK